MAQTHRPLYVIRVPLLLLALDVRLAVFDMVGVVHTQGIMRASRADASPQPLHAVSESWKVWIQYESYELIMPQKDPRPKPWRAST